MASKRHSESAAVGASTPAPVEGAIRRHFLRERVRIGLDYCTHKGHEGIPGAPDGVLCVRCEADLALNELVEQYQTALDRLWEAHDQLCGCDRPADEGRCSAPEETWGAFEYLGERERGPNPATGSSE